MKFWQKTLLIVLALFIIALDICMLIFMQKNWSQNLKREIQRAQNEQVLVINNLLQNLDGIQARGSTVDEQMLVDMIHSYSRYYEKQGIDLQLWKNGVLIFPRVIDDVQIFEQGLEIISKDDVHYIQIGSMFPAPYENMQLRYQRNIDFLYISQSELNTLFLVINIIACIFLAIFLYFIIRRLTKPLRILSTTSAEIAKGNYANRIEIHSKDEFAEVSENFNQMAKAIEAHIDKLSENAEEKQRMIDNLAHELRTPLTAMQGYSEIILSGKISEEERQKATTYILSETIRIKRLAFKLLDIAVSRNQEIEMQTISVQNLFDTMRMRTKAICENNGLILNENVFIESIYGDEELLCSFLMNCIDNACHASKKGDVITLSAYKGNKQIVLEICDQGKGMTLEQVEKAFEPFYRADKSRSRQYGGAGLGLSLCHQIAQIHNATLELESELGVGTKIRMILPVDNKFSET